LVCLSTIRAGINSQVDLALRAQGLSTLNSACSSPCFETLNKTLHNGLKTCQLAWAPLVKRSGAGLVDGGGRDRFYAQLRAVFLSNVIAMADAVAWTRLACVSNYFGARCSVAAWQLASQVPKATCPCKGLPLQYPSQLNNPPGHFYPSPNPQTQNPTIPVLSTAIQHTVLKAPLAAKP
jgi:hypothetical protein